LGFVEFTFTNPAHEPVAHVREEKLDLPEGFL
jgi:hypothetical protein